MAANRGKISTRRAVAPKKRAAKAMPLAEYPKLLSEVAGLLHEARRTSVRAVNAAMTAVYWQIGRHIVEFEQRGARRAEYGDRLLQRLALDLTVRFGRGFSQPNLHKFKQFFLAYRSAKILSTLSIESSRPPASRNFLSTASIKSPARRPEKSDGRRRKQSSSIPALSGVQIAAAFPLSWSHYVRLLSVEDEAARDFYHTEALRCGWSVRQLDRQIASIFYERTAFSRDKEKMLAGAGEARSGEILSPAEEFKDAYVLEFLQLKDEYSETELEEALIHRLEDFLMELGGDFTFMGRQRRLRIGGEWYRIDLLFFHRRLRSLVIVDLKVGKFTHSDAGQMHLYLNYAREHWTHPDENPPVGLILCSSSDAAVAKYSLGGLPNKVMASQYKLALPDERLLAKEIDKARESIERRTT